MGDIMYPIDSYNFKSKIKKFLFLPIVFSVIKQSSNRDKI